MRRLYKGLFQVTGIFTILMLSVVVCASGNDGGEPASAGQNIAPLAAGAGAEQPAVPPSAQPVAPTTAQPAVPASEPAVPASGPQPVVQPTVVPQLVPAVPATTAPVAPACPDRSGLTFPATLQDGARPVKLIITSVDFANDIVTIQNISPTETLTFDDRYRVYTLGSERNLEGISMAPGAILRLHLTSEGQNDVDDVYFGIPTLRIEPCMGEIAVVHNTGSSRTGWFNNPDFVEAYVLWGTVRPFAPSTTYNDEAVGAGAWAVYYSESGASVPTGWFEWENVRCAGGVSNARADDIGIIAIGDVASPAGWITVQPGNEACLAQ